MMSSTSQCSQVAFVSPPRASLLNSSDKLQCGKTQLNNYAPSLFLEPFLSLITCVMCLSGDNGPSLAKQLHYVSIQVLLDLDFCGEISKGEGRLAE